MHWCRPPRSGTGPTAERYYHDPEGQVVEYWFLDVEDTPVMVEATWVPSSSEEEVAELQGSARHPGDHSIVEPFSKWVGGVEGAPRPR